MQLSHDSWRIGLRRQTGSSTKAFVLGPDFSNFSSALGDWAGNWTYPLRLAGKIIQLNSWVSKKCNAFFSPLRCLEWDYIDYIISMIVMVLPRYYSWLLMVFPSLHKHHQWLWSIKSCEPNATTAPILNRWDPLESPHWHTWHTSTALAAQHEGTGPQVGSTWWQCAKKKCLNVWSLSHSKHLFKSFTCYMPKIAQIKMDWDDRAGIKMRKCIVLLYGRSGVNFHHPCSL